MKCAYCRRAIRWRQSLLTPADFHGENYISLSRTDSYRQLLDALFVEHQVKRRMVVETHSAASICAMVRAGVGISVVNPLTALDYAGNGVVVRLLALKCLLPLAWCARCTVPAPRWSMLFARHLQESMPRILTSLEALLTTA
jgi:DNA-binding transcriptional LysR family regulator